MHLAGKTLTCNPPHYGLRVISYFFINCVYELCFLPLLLVFVMNCVKTHCSLPHNSLLLLASFTCVLAPPAHLYMCHLFTHCLPTTICVMLMSIVSFFIVFSLYFCFFLCMCFFLAFVTFVFFPFCAPSVLHLTLM